MQCRDNGWAPFFILLVAVMIFAAFKMGYGTGELDKQHEIVYSCASYGKYKWDGTQEINCSAIIDRSQLRPTDADIQKDIDNAKQKRETAQLHGGDRSRNEAKERQGAK